MLKTLSKLFYKEKEESGEIKQEDVIEVKYEGEFLIFHIKKDCTLNEYDASTNRMEADRLIPNSVFFDGGSINKDTIIQKKRYLYP